MKYKFLNFKFSTYAKMTSYFFCINEQFHKATKYFKYIIILLVKLYTNNEIRVN